MSAKMTIFAHRLFLIFGETKVIEKGRLLQMESTLILSCNKKVYRTAIYLYTPFVTVLFIDEQGSILRSVAANDHSAAANIYSSAVNDRSPPTNKE